MKKIITFLLFVALAFSFVACSFAFESLVDDSANLFTTQEADEISKSADNFISETGVSLAVVTTDDTQGRTTEEFAEDYYDDLADYQGWPEEGMILLIDMDNRVVFTTAVGDTWDIYSDSDISYITDCGYNEVAAGEYGNAMLEMIDAALEVYGNDDSFYGGYIEDGYVDNYYDNDYYYDEYETDNRYYERASVSAVDIIVYIVIGLVVAAITVFVVKSKYKNQGKGDEFDADDMLLNLTGSNDTVISRNVVTTRIPRNSNHGRPGGSGGGASVHRSSGGRVHRSSGRRF